MSRQEGHKLKDRQQEAERHLCYLALLYSSYHISINSLCFSLSNLINDVIICLIFSEIMGFKPFFQLVLFEHGYLP